MIARLNVGGPAAIIDSLVAGADDDFEHVVIAGKPGRGEVDWRDVRGGQLQARYINGLAPQVNPYGDARAIASVARELRKLRPDIVHTHTAKGGMVGRLAAATVPNAHTVHSFHGHVLHGYFSPRVTRGYVELERRLATRTDLLLSVGRRVQEELLAAGIGLPAQHRTVQPGVNPPVLPSRASARQALQIESDAEVVLMLGRLTGIKRLDRALDVVRTLRPRRPKLTLLVAGGGDLEQSLQRQAEDLGPAVRFLGWVGDVGQVIAASDLILLTSDNEGMPVGLIEAAHAGLPAVASNVGGVSEVVLHNQTGVVVDNQVLALAQGCSALLDDPALRQTMADMAIRHAAASFSPSTLVRRHEAIYHEVLR